MTSKVKQLPYDMHLRLATEEDTASLYGLLHRALEASNIPNTINLFDDIKEHLIEFIKDPNNMTLLLCSSIDDKPLGLMLGTVISGPFFFKPYAVEVLWWVDEEGRRGRNPIRMIEAYELWAETKGCSYCQLSLLTTFSRKQAKRLNRLYRSKGYKTTETTYLKELV